MADFVVSSLANAYSAFTSAANGDRVLLTNGTYDVGGSEHDLTKTSSSAVVKFMAQNRLGAILTGEPINLVSNNIIMEGFDLQYDKTSGNYVTVEGDNCQMTRNEVHFANIAAPGIMKWIEVTGNDFLFDYNEMYGKTTIDPMFQISGTPTGTRIFHNYVHDFVQNPGDTKSECFRIGNSQFAYMDLDCEIAYNRIENIDADSEIISGKCTNLRVHHNTLKNTQGSIVLRQAYDCVVDANVLINSGIRLYGSGHQITRNQIIDNTVNSGVNRPIFIASGDREDIPTVQDGFTPGTPGQVVGANNHEARSKNNLIANNIIANLNFSTGIKFVLGDDADQEFQPEGNTITGNIITASTGTLTDAISGTFDADWNANTVSGNILYPTGSAVIGDMPGSGYTNTDPKLKRLTDGSYRCAYMMPLIAVGPNGV